MSLHLSKCTLLEIMCHGSFIAFCFVREKVIICFVRVQFGFILFSHRSLISRDDHNYWITQAKTSAAL